ncbi:MAG: hypothetical protein WC238_03730 [Parcubacteria group bacterium]|jgi:hypothetical protein
MLKIDKVKYMQRYHENRMDQKLAGKISPVAFDYAATFKVVRLAQAVLVNLNKFKQKIF